MNFNKAINSSEDASQILNTKVEQTSDATKQGAKDIKGDVKRIITHEKLSTKHCATLTSINVKFFFSIKLNIFTTIAKFLFIVSVSRLDRNASMNYLKRQMQECSGDARVWISTTVEAPMVRPAFCQHIFAITQPFFLNLFFKNYIYNFLGLA